MMEYTKTENSAANFLTKILKGDVFSKHRESASIVTYMKKQSRDYATRTAATQEEQQLSAANALLMNLDLDFMFYCWIFGLGVCISIMTMIRVALKFLWLTPCRHVLQVAVRMWDWLMKNVHIKTDNHHDRIFICKYGEKFYSSARYKHVIDASIGELKSTVQRLEICMLLTAKQLGWDDASV